MSEGAYYAEQTKAAAAPPVHLAVEETEREAERLLHLLAKLGEKLGPVLPQAPTPESPNSVPRAVPPGSSPIACRLYAVNESLQSCIWRADALLAQLEV